MALAKYNNQGLKAECLATCTCSLSELNHACVPMTQRAAMSAALMQSHESLVGSCADNDSAIS